MFRFVLLLCLALSTSVFADGHPPVTTPPQLPPPGTLVPGARLITQVNGFKPITGIIKNITLRQSNGEGGQKHLDIHLSGDQTGCWIKFSPGALPAAIQMYTMLKDLINNSSAMVMCSVTDTSLLEGTSVVWVTDTDPSSLEIRIYQKIESR